MRYLIAVDAALCTGGRICEMVWQSEPRRCLLA